MKIAVNECDLFAPGLTLIFTDLDLISLHPKRPRGYSKNSSAQFFFFLMLQFV